MIHDKRPEACPPITSDELSNRNRARFCRKGSRPVSRSGLDLISRFIPSRKNQNRTQTVSGAGGFPVRRSPSGAVARRRAGAQEKGLARLRRRLKYKRSRRAVLEATNFRCYSASVITRWPDVIVSCRVPSPRAGARFPAARPRPYRPRKSRHRAMHSLCTRGVLHCSSHIPGRCELLSAWSVHARDNGLRSLGRGDSSVD